MKTLIILAHPRFESSLANKTIVNKLLESSLDIDVRNISALYPDYQIDAKAEQEALLEVDTIVFQYPFYWYNMPAILKLWFDEVFEYQFAYGSKGDKLKAKNFIPSFTIGGSQASYTATGHNSFPITDFTKNLEQTAILAQMNYVKPIVEYSMVYREGGGNAKEAVIGRAEQQAERILECIYSLTKKQILSKY